MTSTQSFIDEITIEELETDPYPFYERLRKEAPVAFVPALGMYIVSTKELCADIAKDAENWPAVISAAGGRTFGPGALLNTNGDEHRKLRDMVEPHLQPSAVDKYIDNLVRPFARQRLAEIENDGNADIVAAYCEPVSVRALGDLLGLDDVSTDKLREWFHKLSVSFTNAAVDENGEFANPDGFIPGDEAKAEIIAHVDPKIDKWIKEPDHTAISHWLHDGMPEGETRSRDVIYPNLYVFLLGAMQEPGHAMATTLAGLFTKPEQLERVVDDPALIPRAVSEGMRWVAPIWSAVVKRAAHEVEVGGVTLPEGSIVMLSYGSANQDENAYNAPTEFDIDRALLPNMTFGGGKHACAGTYFANSVIRIGLEELLEAIPNLERDEAHEVDFWGWGFRGPKQLFVKWEV
ncbi:MULTISPECIES: cytochrome P450 [unclassified Rhodococcus (in: high G+C Gram-positive bacteria)]|jgi:cytochrome P450|uniref:cytochrome P450 n=1 Tax=unclassified Rhodococcus (in: high G+C Gram-positive bacteria) TaxID=192944 RepID=UPI0016397EDF|nr:MULTISPECIES: cytochrome P450 [unclassified Rhodococcus (in: high G+C Gram-positive bacteria)]MBC2644638.1 cytochrome P450 [Rhodococcus sp. 3A]MBC2898236.1 cytochrome P450 [Rhodococcus sp. 4CII]